MGLETHKCPGNPVHTDVSLSLEPLRAEETPAPSLAGTVGVSPHGLRVCLPEAAAEGAPSVCSRQQP